MGRYTVSMDYDDFAKFKRQESELKSLKLELAECVDYKEEGVPIIIHTKNLNNIALRYVPVSISDSEVIVNE